MRPPANRFTCMQRELLEELPCAVVLATRYSRSRIAMTTTVSWSCTSSRARCSTSRARNWGSKCSGYRIAQLRTLDFPSADAELIEKLSLET